MKRLVTLLLCLSLLLAAEAQAAKGPSFAKARAAARKALPTYVLFSCTRASRPVVQCDMMRDGRRWRFVRTVSVRKSGKPRVTRKSKLCRLAPAKTERCTFKLPPR
jgi:hypothetical protein